MKRQLLAVVSALTACLVVIIVTRENSVRKIRDQPPAVTASGVAPNSTGNLSAATPKTTDVKGMARERRVTSYGAEHDLWGFANAALKSGEAPKMYEALRASQECLGLFSQSVDLSIQAGGGGSLYSGAMSPDRQLAIIELNSRCSGFSRAGLDATRMLSKSLNDALTAKWGQAYSHDVLFGNQSESSQALEMLLSSGSPSAIETALIGRVLQTWERANGVDGKTDPRHDLMATAAELATCDLGRDCSKDGLPAITQCALSNQCGDWLWSNWQDGVSEADVKKIEDYKNKLVDAVQDRNWIALGLKNP